ncbi:hypothetical protein DXG01_007618 [Tephrocybe rancida]|nr:hypothetical protein DXG01_007618 [Tephrocybe rancida]
MSTTGNNSDKPNQATSGATPPPPQEALSPLPRSTPADDMEMESINTGPATTAQLTTSTQGSAPLIQWTDPVPQELVSGATLSLALVAQPTPLSQAAGQQLQDQYDRQQQLQAQYAPQRGPHNQRQYYEQQEDP